MGQMLPWADLDRFNEKNGVLRVYQKGRRWAWARLPVAKVWNDYLLRLVTLEVTHGIVGDALGALTLQPRTW